MFTRTPGQPHRTLIMQRRPIRVGADSTNLRRWPALLPCVLIRGLPVEVFSGPSSTPNTYYSLAILPEDDRHNREA
jgi:hypothetical protein